MPTHECAMLNAKKKIPKENYFSLAHKVSRNYSEMYTITYLYKWWIHKTKPSKELMTGGTWRNSWGIWEQKIASGKRQVGMQSSLTFHYGYLGVTKQNFPNNINKFTCKQATRKALCTCRQHCLIEHQIM